MLYSFEQVSDWYFVLKRHDNVASFLDVVEVWAEKNLNYYYERKMIVNRFECEYYGESWHFSSLDDALKFKLVWCKG